MNLRCISELKERSNRVGRESTLEEDVDRMNSMQGAMVTITGGTGSFGSTMAMDLLGKGVGGINIFSRDEAKQDAMRRRIDGPRVATSSVTSETRTAWSRL